MNRTVLVTGASGSMGSAATRSLAAAGDRVIMACRNPLKAESVRREILADVPGAGLDILELDISSPASVRRAAASLDGERIDALFNNAGTISRAFGLTPDGFENTLATNYLGPYLLTNLLIENMAPGSAVVNMVSLTCRFGRVEKDIFERGEKDFRRLRTYADSKLALLLFSVSLAERYPEIHVNVADPGIVNSNMITMGKWFDPLADIFFRPFCKKPQDGVRPALDALHYNGSGQYFAGRKHSPVAAGFVSHPLRDWLWDETGRRLEIPGR